MPNVHAIVGGRISIPEDDLPPYVYECLRQRLSVKNPEYRQLKRLRKSTRRVEEDIDCVASRDGWVHVPRGAVYELLEACQKRDLAVEFEDHRTEGSELPGGPNVLLRPYQTDAAHEVKKHLQGVAVIPCGGGKTILGVALIRELGRSAIVLVHTRDLLEQWTDELSDHIGVQAGIVAEGKREVSDVTVATVQTLARMSRRDLAKLAARFGVLIVDEAHHTPATIFRDVITEFPARWRLGLTATPDRSDGLTKILYFTMGLKLYEITYDELIGLGFLQRPRVREVHTTFSYDIPEEKDDKGRVLPTNQKKINACMDALIRHEPRNDLIANVVGRDYLEGHSFLTLSRRIEHCKTLAGKLRGLGVPTELLIGDVRIKSRREILDGLRSGSIRSVVASTVADEGLNVPRLNRICLAFPERTKSKAIQRVGRIMRVYESKDESILYDVVDSRVPLLERRWKDRQAAFRKVLGSEHEQYTLEGMT